MAPENNPLELEEIELLETIIFRCELLVSGSVLFWWWLTCCSPVEGKVVVSKSGGFFSHHPNGGWEWDGKSIKSIKSRRDMEVLKNLWGSNPKDPYPSHPSSFDGPNPIPTIGLMWVNPFQKRHIWILKIIYPIRVTSYMETPETNSSHGPESWWVELAELPHFFGGEIKEITQIYGTCFRDFAYNYRYYSAWSLGLVM